MLFEIWKDIKGFEGKYQVSNLGNIKHLLKHGKSKILNPSTEKHGYKVVVLYNKGTVRTFKVHRIVAETFIEKPLNKEQINHIDGNKTNNRVDNLEWCTAKENMNHAFKNGLCNNKKNGKGVRAVKVAQLDKENNLIAIYVSQTVAAKINNISTGVISACSRGILKTGGGYKWAYIDDGKKED